MKSIKSKLLVFVLALLLISSAVLGAIAIMISTVSITKEAEDALMSMAEQGAHITEMRLSAQYQSLGVISGLPTIVGMNWSDQQATLSVQAKNTNFLDFAVADLSGRARFQSGMSLDVSQESYFLNAKMGQNAVSDVIVNTDLNTLTVYYAVPIYKGDSIVGVLIGERDGAGLSAITNSIGFREQGYAYAINDQGVVVSHRDIERVYSRFDPITLSETDASLETVAGIFRKILNDKVGVGTYRFNCNDLYADFHPIEGTNWYIVVTANKDEVLVALPSMVRSMLVLMLIVAIIGSVMTYFISAAIANPIVRLKNVALDISHLDLSVSVDSKLKGYKDEIGSLAASLQAIIDALRQTIHKVSETSHQLATSSEALTATAKLSAHAAEDVAKTISEIASSASEQSENTEKGAYKAIELGKAIQTEQENIVILAECSVNVSGAVEGGLEVVDVLASISDKSTQDVAKVQDDIMNTNDSAQRISEASRFIAGIADQTNLLALNAAIEAARAGEAGRGFAVVADEIRKLAEQSTQSTKMIDDIVIELQRNSSHSVEAILNLSSVFEALRQGVVQSKSRYVEIADAMKRTGQAVDILMQSSGAMDKMKEDIVDTLQGLSAIAQENSASTEEVSAAMEEQTASVEEVSAASVSLAELAEELQSLIVRFKL